MDRSTHDLLLAADVAGRWESPVDADWQRSIAEVNALKPQLEGALGCKLRLDDGVQDASFFADLGVLMPQHHLPVIALGYEIAFRFSWFGRLYTVHGLSWQSRLDPRACAILAQAGFVHVPAAALDEPYDGVNPPYEPGLTWWTRFFDYL